MKRFEKVVLWSCVPALVFVVSSAVPAAEPEGFEQTKLESGVTVADIEPLKDGRLLMVLDHDGELRASFSHDDGKTWKASFHLLPNGCRIFRISLLRVSARLVGVRFSSVPS